MPVNIWYSGKNRARQHNGPKNTRFDCNLQDIRIPVKVLRNIRTAGLIWDKDKNFIKKLFKVTNLLTNSYIYVKLLVSY